MQIRNIFSIPLGITVNEQHKKIQKNLVKYCTKLKNKKRKEEDFGSHSYIILMVNILFTLMINLKM